MLFMSVENTAVVVVVRTEIIEDSEELVIGDVNAAVVSIVVNVVVVCVVVVVIISVVVVSWSVVDVPVEESAVVSVVSVVAVISVVIVNGDSDVSGECVLVKEASVSFCVELLEVSLGRSKKLKVDNSDFPVQLTFTLFPVKIIKKT